MNIGTIAAIGEDKLSICVTFSVVHDFKINQTVSVSRKKTSRTDQQNGYYWALLNWLFKTKAIQNHGYFSVSAFHEAVKSWIKSEHKHDFRPDYSTTDLNIPEMVQFVELLKMELLGMILGIDTSLFDQKYEEFKIWQTYHPEGTFREFMDA